LVNNIVRDMAKHARRAKLKLTAQLTVHTLRKSFAQNHASAGTPCATLKSLMGHASITTTEKYYLQQSDENEKAALDRYESLLSEQTAVRLLYEPPQDRAEGSAVDPSEKHAHPGASRKTRQDNHLRLPCSHRILSPSDYAARDSNPGPAD